MSDKLKVQVYLPPETIQKLDELAKLLGGTRAGVATFCIEETIRDKGWLFKHVAAPVRQLLVDWGMQSEKWGAELDPDAPQDAPALTGVKGVPHAG